MSVHDTPKKGWSTSLRSRAPFLAVLPQRATSYTWAHMNITPSLPRSHTYICSARFIVNITHEHDNDRNLQAVYCYACYVVGPPTFKVNNWYKCCDLYTNKYGICIRATWNVAKSGGLARYAGTGCMTRTLPPCPLKGGQRGHRCPYITSS